MPLSALSGPVHSTLSRVIRQQPALLSQRIRKPRASLASRGLSLLLCLLMISSQLASTAQAQAQAQGVKDSTPPVIRIAPLSESSAERRQAFTAQVSDEQQLAEVILFLRRAGDKVYQPLLMTSLGTSQFYNTSIDTDPADLRALEFYVEAHDAAGNRGISGYAFDPYRRTLTAPAATLAGKSAAADGRAYPTIVDDQIGSERSRWWAIALGVLAAGTVAALASSGGGDSNTSGGGVPLSINIQEP